MMKRIWVIVANILIIVSMVVFVFIYSSFEANNIQKTQIEHFENTTVTMERVTENYLEGEQRICDVWAHYINSENMTIDEAISFIRVSHVLKSASAHIVYNDNNLSGLSTRPKKGTTADYNVSYKDLDLLKDLSWIHEIGTSINISRAYTDSISGNQSHFAISSLFMKEESIKKQFYFAFFQKLN